MSFEQIIALASVGVSALAIVSPCILATIENKKRTKQAERDVCVKILKCCKMVFINKMNKENIEELTEQYVLLQLIKNKKLKQKLQTCLDEIISQKPTATDLFAECLSLFANCNDYSL